MASSNSLYDELDSDLDGNNTITQGLTGAQLVEINPDEVAKFDSQHEHAIFRSTDTLKKSLVFCEKVVIAAYNVAEYVPDLRNDKHAKFWKDEVLPNLVDSLKQDVKARSVMTHAFGAVRDLAITVQKGAEIVQQSRGSTRAIEIAKESIPNALKKLEKCIAQVSTLENSAINAFASKTKAIFEIIGPKAADFVEQKAEIEYQLNKLYDKQKAIIEELGEKQAELSRYGYLITATEKNLGGVTQEAELNKRRVDDLNNLNSRIEQTIQSIPATTTHTTYSGGWWRWWWGGYRTTHERVDNPTRESETRYYESIIIARKARLRDELGAVESKEKILKDLTTSLSEYKSKYEKVKLDVENLNTTVKERIDLLQKEVEALHTKMEEIEQNRIDVEGMVGLQGNSLIECLVAVRTFSRSLRAGTSAYAPLVSVLEGIKTIVQSDVCLLSGTDRDVFLAGTRLMKSVGFLAKYSTNAGEVLEISNEFRALAIEG